MAALVGEGSEQDVSLVPTFRRYKSVSKKKHDPKYLELSDKSASSWSDKVMFRITMVKHRQFNTKANFGNDMWWRKDSYDTKSAVGNCVFLW